jgi:hypothetical protein
MEYIVPKNVFWGRARSRADKKGTVKTFGDVVNKLRAVCETGAKKNKIYALIDVDDIVNLEDVYKALFVATSKENRQIKRSMPVTNGDKRSHGNELKKLLDAYAQRMAARSTGFAAIDEKIALQLAAIAKIPPMLPHNPEPTYDAVMAAIRLITEPNFTNLLRLLLPPSVPIEELQPHPDALAKKLTIDDARLDSILLPDDPGMQHIEFFDLRKLFPSDPNQNDLMLRLSKQSAMRGTNLDAKEAAVLSFYFSNDAHDFNKTCSSSELLAALKTSVTHLSDKTNVRTHGKVSQYHPVHQRWHETNKSKLYQNRFVAQQKHNEHIVKRKDDASEVLQIQVMANAAANVCGATITVPVDQNMMFDTQAIVVDQLRQFALKLGAVSVAIGSRAKDNNSIDLENVLRGAFNAVHANLLPRFDNDTWILLKQYANKAVPLNSVMLDDTNAYVARYRSKEFADFLLSIRPTTENNLSYEDFYLRTSQLQISLNYQPHYTLNRSTRTH